MMLEVGDVMSEEKFGVLLGSRATLGEKQTRMPLIVHEPQDRN
jgi:hypothetical protein